MIDIRKLKELVRLMVGNDLTEIDLRDSEEQVTLRRKSPLDTPQVVHAPVQPAAVAATPAVSNGTAAASPTESAAPAQEKPADAGDDAGLVPIVSPMVGTFYATPDPDSPAFANVGDRVSPDTIVCLIEAMKIFNEIKAEQAGIIERICVKSGDAIEFGETLFLIRPA